MNMSCARIGRWLLAALLAGNAAGASPPQQAAIDPRGGNGFPSDLIALPDAASDWRIERIRSGRGALRPLMTRKTREFYYSVPVGPALTLKPGISHFKQPRDGFGRTVGRTVVGVSASIKLGL